MKIITICGSFKFKNEMMKVAEYYSLQGNVVILPNFPIRENYTKEEIQLFGDMHKEKIKLSDSVVIVNVDNYIGLATKTEIDLAKSLNKEIIYYTEIINKL
ncbi:MAG: hypothetical protein IJW28_04570 [Clostridia bacterium]|nr:hypothetical protein [Clostridia bacterium]